MSESHNADGVKSTDGQQLVTADGSENSNKPQVVKYETYDKAMASLAKEKQARQELEKKLQEIREKEMLEQGKYQELLQQKESELRELKEKALREQAAKIEANVKSKITEVATRFGAYDAGDVIKNISIKELGVDAEGNVDVKIVEQKVEEMKARKAYLFKQAAARVADGAPKMTVDMKPKAGSTIEQLKQQYIEAAMRNKN